MTKSEARKGKKADKTKVPDPFCTFTLPLYTPDPFYTLAATRVVYSSREKAISLNCADRLSPSGVPNRVRSTMTIVDVVVDTEVYWR